MIYQNQHIQRIQQHPKRNFFAFIFLVAIIAVVGISLWFVRQQILPNPHAAASTTLSFTPATETVNTGETVTSSIIVDPGSNKVSLVKIKLTYDGSKLSITSAPNSLVVNKDAFPETLEQPSSSCNGTQCTLTATFSVGSDPTKAVQAKTTVANLTVNAIAQTNGTPTMVAYDSPSAVYSIASTDQASENILSSTNPLAITIGGSNVCQPNQSSCSWDTIDNVTTYHYKVEDNSSTVIQEGDINAPQTSVNFPSEAGKTYTCNVTAANTCGKGTAGSGMSTCPAPSVTITPSVCEGPGDVTNIQITCPNCAHQ